MSAHNAGLYSVELQQEQPPEPMSQQRQEHGSHQHQSQSVWQAQQQPLPTSSQLRVLVVDSKAASRLNVTQLLRDCSYQVCSVRSTKEALQLLAPGAAGDDLPFDLLLKEHEPPEANGCRLLRRMARTELLAKLPVVLVSSNDEREVVMKCLTLGAIDYLIKPLRHNELRHIWTRVWWWRRSGMGGGEPHPLVNTDSIEFQASSEDSKDTKCDDEEEPTSKEGSAPDNGNGSNGNGTSGHNHGSNENGNGASGNGASRVEAKVHVGDGNGNGSSGNNDNSASKNGHHNGHGSNGNGASTSLAEHNALLNTAEGKPPPNAEPLRVATGRSFRPYNPEGSRKRPATAAHAAELVSAADTHRHHHHHHHQTAVAENTSNQGLMQDSSAPQHAGSTRSSGGHGGRAKMLPMRGGDWDKTQGASVSPGSAACAVTPPSQVAAGDQECSGHAAAAAQTPCGLIVAASAAGIGDAAAARGSASCGAAVLPGSAGGHAASDDTVTVDIGPTEQPQSQHHQHHQHQHQHLPGVGNASALGALLPALTGSLGSAFGHPGDIGGGGSGAAATTQLRVGSSAGGSLGPIVGSTGPGTDNTLMANSMRQSSAFMGQSAVGTAACNSAAPKAEPMDTGLGASTATPASQVPAAEAAAAAGSAASAPGSQLTVPPMGIPGAWGGHAAQMQGAMHPGQAQPVYPPQAYGGMYPGAAMPYHPLMNLPPHMLHQLHPQVLQALFGVEAPGHQHPQAGPSVDPMQSAAMVSAAMYPGMPGLYHMSAAAPWHQHQHQHSHQHQHQHHHHHPQHHQQHQHSAVPQQQQQMHMVVGQGALPQQLPQPAHVLPGPAPMAPMTSGEHPPTGLESSLGGAAVGSALTRLPLLESRKRRAAALARYRKKRQNLKFAKTIRYENRKQLAHQRPRVKGQFVKQGQDMTGRGNRLATGTDATGAEEDTQDEEGEVVGGRGGFGGQNFDEEGEYDRNPDDDAMEEDEEEEEEGGGGSGTDAGDGLHRAAQRPACVKTPDSEEPEQQPEADDEPIGEDAGEEEDDVVNSLRKLREGKPKGPALGASKPAKSGAGTAGGAVMGSGPVPATALSGATGVAGQGAAGQAQGGGAQAPVLESLGSKSGQDLSSSRNGSGESHGGGNAGGGGSALARLLLTRGSQKVLSTPAPGHSPDAGVGPGLGGTAQGAGAVAPGGAGAAAHRHQGNGGHSGPGHNNKNGGSDSGSNSPDENGGNGHRKGAVNVVSSLGSGDGGSGHQSRGGSHETSGHGSVADEGQVGPTAPVSAGRHDKR